MFYPFIRKLLFLLDPEKAHTVALRSLQLADQLGLARLFANTLALERTLMGLTFKNPVGLAAGLDKNADYVDALFALGFGFIEIGTVTPLPQPGNPRPRLFRLIKEEALINRMGFNSKGIEQVVKNLEKRKSPGILGINIGKNLQTPLEKAVDDYVIGFRELWKFANYITINISSPNTPGLRNLQQDEALNELLGTLKQEQQKVETAHNKYVPMVVKVSPDLSREEVSQLAEALLNHHIDGVIIGNTSLSREGVLTSPYAKEAGGLSGKPLQVNNVKLIHAFSTCLQNKMPIIAAGGIMDAVSGRAKIEAGASLLQIYTGFIYQGPALIETLVRALSGN